MEKKKINNNFNLDIYKIENISNDFVFFEGDNVKIKNIIFLDDINLGFIDNEKYNIKIFDCIFEGDINFDLNGSIDFNSCIFKKEIHFSSYIKELISLNYYKCEFNKGLYLEYFSVGLLVFYENKGDINVKSLTTGNFIIIPIGKYSINISFLKVSKSFSIGGTLNRLLDKIKLNDVKFFSDEDVSIIFQNIIVGELVLNNFLNYSKNFNFQNLVLESFDIENSDLGKITFNGVQINKLYLENTTLNDCVFNGVEFPKNYELDEGELSNKQLKDNYRQLKFMMDKNGNYTEGNKFYEKEMEYYLKSLNIEKKGFLGTFRELFDLNFLGEKAKKKGEEIVLLFGWNINEFGNNWLRSLQTIILVALFSVIIDGVSTFLGIKYGNFLGDFIIIALFIILIFGFLKFNFDKSLDVFLEKHKNVDYYLMIFLFIGILVFYFLPNFDPLRIFGNLLNPLYFYERGIYYNGIETLGLVLYKTIYGILLWHLGVALKRTTKR